MTNNDSRTPPVVALMGDVLFTIEIVLIDDASWTASLVRRIGERIIKFIVI